MQLASKAVIFAKDARRLADFYGQVLALSAADEGATFVTLVSNGLELTIVQAPQADAIVVTQPPEVREETPIKLSFAVPAIEALRAKVAALGGALRDPATAWAWRGERHQDGWDPEGNVFQLRELEAASETH